MTVIDPEAEIAAALSQTGKVGVLATPATVRSGAYLRALAAQQRALTVTEVEAPDLAAVIQRGFPFDESVVEMVRSYCEPLKRAEVDTVILGCTHYPLVRPDAAAGSRTGRAPGHRGTRDRGDGGAGPGGSRTREEPATKRGPTGSSAPGTRRPSASSGRASCRCR